MTRSQRVIQLRSYALAFAVVLSPAFFQAYSCTRGDTYLLSLKLLVDGQDQIQGFNANNRSYAATIYSHTLTLTVVTRKLDSRATVQWIVDGTTIEALDIGLGGGTVVLTVPEGQSELYIGVRAVEGNVDGYTVDVSTCTDGASCPFEGETGLCFDRVCRSGQCDGVDFFQGCGEPMTGGWEGACISDLCVSVAPVDECVKSGIGRVNCCSQQGCIDGLAAGCAEYSPDGTSCDPSNIEAPGGQGQAGTCEQGACVANAGSGYGPCEGVRCDPPTGPSICKRNDCDPSTGQCAEWAVDGTPPCMPGSPAFCFGGACFTPSLCAGVDCSDTNPCTADYCDFSTAVNGVCVVPDCCVHRPRQPGAICGTTQGQTGYCNDNAECQPGTVGNEISMGCTDSLDPAIKLMPFELLVTPGSDLVIGGTINSMTVGGFVHLPEAYLDELQTLLPGGVDKVDVRELRATAFARSGALGVDAPLPSEPTATTCALGASVACDPANDQAGTPGHRPNTDCVPVASSNPCGRFVSIPTSTDCDPAGVCSTIDDWQNTKQSQCADNGFCVTGRVDLGLQDQSIDYQAYRSGRVLLGWDDQNTGATVQSGGPNDGTWILSPAVYTNPVGPNGLRLGFVNSTGGQNADVAIECTMAVDSQGPDGVYSQDPLSSPTPDYTAASNYRWELLSTLDIFPTGYFERLSTVSEGFEVCLNIEGTSLTPSARCDIDNTGVPHSFQIRHDGSSCAVPLVIDFTQTLPVTGGSFGLDPLLPTHFDGYADGFTASAPFHRIQGTARTDAANCSVSWNADPQPTDLPDGGICDLTSAPCTLGCGSVGCSQYCLGDGTDCEMSCPGGSCTQLCELGAECAMTCVDGCVQQCDSVSTCSMQCGTGSGSACTVSCGGATCPDPGECNTNQCNPGTNQCVATPLADGADCYLSDPVPATCNSGQCTTTYDGYVVPAGDTRFRLVFLDSGWLCCFDTPIEISLSGNGNIYVDPALCDSYVENNSGGGLRLDYVGGGGACCYATVADILASWPDREICDGR